jgi:hypothetical protein
MRDSTDIYRDTANNATLWNSLHRDATRLEKDAFAATHIDTIRQHYLNNGFSLSTAEAHDMAHEVWWDVRVLGVDPTIGLHMPPNTSASRSRSSHSRAPTSSR